MRFPTQFADIDVLRGIIDAVPHPIFVKDVRHRFRLVNQAMCEFMGRRPEELLFHTDHDFVPTQQADLYQTTDLRVLETGEANESEEPFTDQSGRQRSVVTRKRRLVLADGSCWLICCINDISAYRRAEELIRYNAEHDTLTGLLNRAVFRDGLDRAIGAGDAVRAALLLIDLDGFKTINDLLGHAAGDGILMETASILAGIAGADDVVARLGGDEFAVIQRGAAQPEGAAALAAQIIERLSRPMFLNGRMTQVSASVGVAIITAGADAEIVLRQADLALYRAKKDGRNLWRVFEPEMEASQILTTFLAEDLRSALARRQLSLVYQPIVATRDLSVVGYEALLRWHHPVRGLISPVDFIPLAEAGGAITQLGEWVLREACTEAMRWPAPHRIAVNVSPVQFAEIELPELVMSAVRQTGIDPHRIDIEITESAVIRDLERARRIFAALRGIGAKVVLDDFGVGYSSLQILKSLPFDKVKIDRSLLQDVGRTPEATAILEAILQLGRTLRLSLTVEGVETPEQLAVLQRSDCDELQGFLIGRPNPKVAGTRDGRVPAGV